MVSKSKALAELLESDGDVVTSALDNANISVKVYSVKPTTVTANGTTITIIGEGFVNGATVHFVSAEDGVQTAAASVTYVSATKLTITNPQLKAAAEPWSVKVTNPNGQSAAIESVIDAGGVPAWSTAAGKIGDDTVQNSSFSSTVAASDPEGTAITYSESGTDVLTGSGTGKLNFTLNASSGAITGTMPALGSDTTFNFTLGAAAGGDITTRNFNIVGKVAHPDYYIFRGDGEGGTGTSDTSVWNQQWSAFDWHNMGSTGSSGANSTKVFTSLNTTAGNINTSVSEVMRTTGKISIPSSHNKMQIKSSTITGGSGNGIILSSTANSANTGGGNPGGYEHNATYPGGSSGMNSSVGITSADQVIALGTGIPGNDWYFSIWSYAGNSTTRALHVTVVRTYYEA